MYVHIGKLHFFSRLTDWIESNCKLNFNHRILRLGVGRFTSGGLIWTKRRQIYGLACFVCGQILRCLIYEQRFQKFWWFLPFLPHTYRSDFILCHILREHWIKCNPIERLSSAVEEIRPTQSPCAWLSQNLQLIMHLTHLLFSDSACHHLFADWNASIQLRKIYWWKFYNCFSAFSSFLPRCVSFPLRH